MVWYKTLQDIHSMKKCSHNSVIEGPELNRVYGTMKTQFCIICKQYWRTLDHYNQPLSKWTKKPFLKELINSILDDEEM